MKLIYFLSVVLLLTFSLPVQSQLNIDYFMKKGINELFSDNYTLAIRTFNTLIRSKPDMAEPRFYRGVAKYNLGDYRGAEFDFTRAIMLDPYNPHAYHYRGIAKTNLYNYHSALEDFEKSIERRPNNPFVYLSRGATKMQMKNYKGAIIDFDTVIIINPEIEEAYLNRAIARSKIEDYEDAVKDCNQAIKLNIFYKEAFVKRGFIKNEMDDFDGAMKDFDQAIKLDENDPLIYFFRSIARVKVGDTTGALADYNIVLHLDPYNDLTYYNRALLMMQKGEYKKAIDDLDRVLKINPENVFTWYNRGFAKVNLKDFQGAIDDFSKAIEIFPDFAAAYMSRSNVKSQLGDNKGAGDDYDIAFGIINAVNSGEDFGFINQKYSSDSTYLQKIIEFEADFNSNNVVGGRIQNRRALIQMMPNFSIQYFKADSVIAERKETGYHCKLLDGFKYNNPNFSLWISSKKHQLSEKDAGYFLEKVDSIVYFQPFDPDNYFLMGTINAMLMNFTQAKIAYDRAIQLRPDFLMAYFNRANINFELAEHEFSIEESTPRITITKGQTITTSTERERKIPDFSKALEDYNKVVALNPNMSYAYYNRGNIKARMRDFEGALEDYTTAVRLEPNFAEAFYNRALTLIYLKDTKTACLDLSKAGELGVGDAYSVIKRYCNK